MSADDPITQTFTRQEWQIIMVALGEIQGKVMFAVAQKVDALLKQETPK